MPSRRRGKTRVKDTGTDGTAAARWQRGVNERINHKIRLLQEEFEEINFLRQVADEKRNLREKFFTERCD